MAENQIFQILKICLSIVQGTHMNYMYSRVQILVAAPVAD